MSNQVSTPPNSQTDRKISWDILKFFAIFLVLWGHCIQHFLNSNHYEEPVYRYIYSFHMPLFMAISGFFGARITNKKFSTMLLGKMRQLILPSITFAAILFLVYKFLRYLNVDLDWEWNLHEHVIFSLWYVKSLFFCLTLYYISSYSAKFRNYSLILSLLLSQAIKIYKFNYMYPSFLLGTLIYHNYDYFKANCKYIFFISGTIFLVMLSIWDERFWKIPAAENMKSLLFDDSSRLLEYLFKRFYKLFIGLVGAVTFISLFEYLSTKLTIKGKILERISANTAYVGRHTLGIYLIQSIILETILRAFIDLSNTGFIIFNFMISPLISLALIYVIQVVINIIHKGSFPSFIILGEKLKR